jgi:hypothetical protein
MNNTIEINGFTWEQVPVDMIEYLDCEVYILHDDGSESLIQDDRHYMYDDLTYVIEPNDADVARAWLVANGYEAETLENDVIMRVTNDKDEVLHVQISDYTLGVLADRFRREAFQ